MFGEEDADNLSSSPSLATFFLFIKPASQSVHVPLATSQSTPRQRQKTRQDNAPCRRRAPRGAVSRARDAARAADEWRISLGQSAAFPTAAAASPPRLSCDVPS